MPKSSSTRQRSSHCKESIQKKVFPFFRLARELRDQIYEEADVSTRLKTAERCLKAETTVALSNMPNVGLLLASRQTKTEYDAARARKNRPRRLVVELRDLKDLSMRLRKARFWNEPVQAHRDPQRDQAISKLITRLRDVKNIDIHLSHASCRKFDILPGHNPFLDDASTMLQRILPNMGSVTVRVVVHDDLISRPRGYPYRPTVEMLRQITDCLLMNRVDPRFSRNDNKRLTREQIKQYALFHCRLFTPYEPCYPPEVDPDGHLRDMIKKHRQNEVVLQAQILEHNRRPGNTFDYLTADVTLTPFCQPGQHVVIEDEVVEGFLQLYDEKTTMETLEAELKPEKISREFVVDPQVYADFAHDEGEARQ